MAELESSASISGTEQDDAGHTIGLETAVVSEPSIPQDPQPSTEVAILDPSATKLVRGPVDEETVESIADNSATNQLDTAAKPVDSAAISDTVPADKESLPAVPETPSESAEMPVEDNRAQDNIVGTDPSNPEADATPVPELASPEVTSSEATNQPLSDGPPTQEEPVPNESAEPAESSDLDTSEKNAAGFPETIQTETVTDCVEECASMPIVEVSPEKPTQREADAGIPISKSPLRTAFLPVQSARNRPGYTLRGLF